ncbi:MAG: hypothetical protein WHX60_06245 [Armatimonadota bacterium]
MARQLYGARVGEELLRRFEKAAVLPVPGVFCPVWVRSGGVLPVMLKGQLDENAVPFRKAHDFLEASDNLHVQPAGFHRLIHHPIGVFAVPVTQPHPCPVHVRPRHLLEKDRIIGILGSPCNVLPKGVEDFTRVGDKLFQAGVLPNETLQCLR